MASNINLQAIGSLGELNFSKGPKSSTVIVTKLGSSVYGVLVFNYKKSRVSLLKLILDKLYMDKNNIIGSLHNQKDSPFQVSLLKIFCFPYNLLDIVQTSENFYAIGCKDIVDLKPYLQSVLEEDEMEQSMDIDQIEEFNSSAFEVTISCSKHQPHNFQIDDIFIKCNFIDYGVIKCTDDSINNVWCLELLILKESKMHQGKHTMKILDLPKVNNKNIAATCSPDTTMTFHPVFCFIHHTDVKCQVLKNMFGLSCQPPNSILLIGHPDGSLMWALCDLTGKCEQLPQLQTLHSVKQPITAIHIVDVSSYKNKTFLIVVGAFGQVTFFSMDTIPSFTVTSGTHPFWTLTVHLKSTIQESVVLQHYLLHLSIDGTLSITDLALYLSSTPGKSCIATTPTEFCNINQLVILDKNKGLMILCTDIGNAFLVGLCKESHLPSSLPLLMNECLQQSTKMQELMFIKSMQNKLFVLISTFASFKFGVKSVNESFPFSITQVNENPAKYVLMIGLRPLEQLTLDPELCFVSVSIFTYFGKEHRLVNKTIPYNPEQEAVCIELLNTDLNSPFSSVFPLLVEIGVILQLPKAWKNIDCFKIVASCLPFHLSLHSFRVYYLHLFQNNVLCFPQSHECKKVKTSFEAINSLGRKRPICNLLQDVKKADFEYPARFNLCLSLSSVENMMKHSGDTDACKFIEELLTRNTLSFQAVLPSTTKSCPLSVTVSKKDNYLLVTLTTHFFESLVGARMAIVDVFLQCQNMTFNGFPQPSSYINIPASMYRKCEEVSKSIMDLYGKDVHTIEVTEIIKLYQELRHISAMLPIF